MRAGWRNRRVTRRGKDCEPMKHLLSAFAVRARPGRLPGRARHASRHGPQRRRDPQPCRRSCSSSTTTACACRKWPGKSRCSWTTART
jgi:hypothetical protein